MVMKWCRRMTGNIHVLSEGCSHRSSCARELGLHFQSAGDRGSPPVPLKTHQSMRSKQVRV
jgi:hypothetical protein